MISAHIIADSMTRGSRLTTFQLRYHRYVHAELMTHRVFSRNAMSSRAVPVKKMIEQVRNEPAIPIHWGKNQKGMQAEQELSESQKRVARQLWYFAAESAARTAEQMDELGLHKQVANRILEPFQFISVIVSATEFDNFFALRAHPDAMPEINKLAKEMLELYNDGVPNELEPGSTKVYDYHLPYIEFDELSKHPVSDLVRMSAARCARVSYLTHDSKKPTHEEDLALYDRLSKALPPHLSPLEHQARPLKHSETMNLGGNFNSSCWVQYRKLFEQRLEQVF